MHEKSWFQMYPYKEQANDMQRRHLKDNSKNFTAELSAKATSWSQISFRICKHDRALNTMPAGWRIRCERPIHKVANLFAWRSENVSRNLFRKGQQSFWNFFRVFTIYGQSLKRERVSWACFSKGNFWSRSMNTGTVLVKRKDIFFRPESLVYPRRRSQATSLLENRNRKPPSPPSEFVKNVLLPLLAVADFALICAKSESFLLSETWIKGHALLYCNQNFDDRFQVEFAVFPARYKGKKNNEKTQIFVFWSRRNCGANSGRQILLDSSLPPVKFCRSLPRRPKRRRSWTSPYWG